MREFLSFKAIENKISRKQRTKYLLKTAEKNPKAKNLNAWVKAVWVILSVCILATAFTLIYYNPIEYEWYGTLSALLGISILCTGAASLLIRKASAAHHGYQSLSLLCDKIVIKEIQRWVRNNDIPSERLLNVYLPHVQKLLEEHKKTSIIERFKSQWGKIFLLPSTLFIVFSFIFQLPGAEDASSNELLYVGFLILIIGVMVLVIIGFVTFGILSFSVPDFDRRFYARLELALTIASYR